MPFAFAALVTTVSLGLAAAAPAGPEAHVARVAASVAPHVRGSAQAAPAVSILERPEAVAGAGDGRIEVSTGLLSRLASDAELAMVLSYELGRGVPLGAGVPRRRGRGASRDDDRCVHDALLAVMAAGHDGEVASAAWDRLARAAAGTAPRGGYDDASANERRGAAAVKALRGSGGPAAVVVAAAAGVDSYQAGVLAHLSGWKVTLPGPSSAKPGDPATDVTGARTWLTYHRAGGLTGWSADLAIQSDGGVWASESHRKEGATQRPRLASAELAELHDLVSAALSLPPRKGKPELRFLRDGMTRYVEVRAEGQTRSLSLTDGYELTAADHELIRALESLVRGGQ